MSQLRLTPVTSTQTVPPVRPRSRPNRLTDLPAYVWPIAAMAAMVPVLALLLIALFT